jgi:hypothetical protein
MDYGAPGAAKNTGDQPCPFQWHARASCAIGMRRLRPSRDVMKDIAAVEWLPLSAAVRRLSYPLEKLFLHHVGRRVLKRRHRKAARRKTAKARHRKTAARRR